MIFSSQYLLIMIVSIALGALTQSYINSTFRKWSNVPLESGLTGAQVAERILGASGVRGVGITAVRGRLTDHYDPRSKTLALSEVVYASSSVAAAGVAAHEVGHAIQDDRGYVWNALRSSLVPVANLGSQAAGILILLGFMINLSGLLWLGVIAYAAAVAFQLVTLPVELNASRRALVSLEQTGALPAHQMTGARQVLTAAALTYVAAALISLLNLMYYFGLANRD